MPTFMYYSKCDGCGKCVDMCPSDILHIHTGKRKAYNIEPDMCWECYTCVKICPQNAIDVRGYSDFAPFDHKVTVLREEEKNVISWKIKYRNGKIKYFTFPIRTTAWGSIRGPHTYDTPNQALLETELLSHEPEKLMIPGGLPTLNRSSSNAKNNIRGKGFL